jgi:ubiquitin-conjugating enzyme E2 J1
MADSRYNRTILQNFRKAKESNNPYVKHVMSTDIRVWYILLHGFSGDQDEFVGGEYLCKIVLPLEFPRDPPEFYMMTPNGVYGCDGKACISIGEFHANIYPNTLGVTGFVEQLVSGFIGWKTIGKGTRLLDTTVEEKKALAERSQEYNTAHYADILALFK